MWNQNSVNNQLYCVDQIENAHATYSNIIKNLCSKLADENSIIFKNNALIMINIGKLMSKQFVFDESALRKMLSHKPKEDPNQKQKNQDKKNDNEKETSISEETISALWRRAGQYVVEIAINLKVEIVSGPKYAEYLKTGLIKENQDTILFKRDLILISDGLLKLLLLTIITIRKYQP